MYLLNLKSENFGQDHRVFINFCYLVYFILIGGVAIEAEQNIFEIETEGS